MKNIMLKSNFNQNWKFVKGCIPSLMTLKMYGKEADDISLPHDAMIHETPCETTKNGGATGFYPGGIYTYFKTFVAPEEWKDKTVTLEFEGVYEKAMVYLNGALITTNSYGYSNFYASLDRYLQYGQENELKVVADNSAEQNSRWYTGSGIYRNVNLFVGELIQIPVDGVHATTINVEKDFAVVEFVTTVVNQTRKKEKLQVQIEMSDEDGNVIRGVTHLTAFGNSENQIRQEIVIKNPKLWNCDTPHLYKCQVSIFSEKKVWDTNEFLYGIRRITLDSVYGLRINGESVKLRGTCVHHDNGILGAATYREAEYRKCKLLKQAGFNSVRSAHHPAAKDFLDACDKYGILVMDELCDMWTIHKNDHDYAFSFLNEWKNIVDKMIQKDYNHPSVIMYSIGNEIQEVGTERGAEINRTICNYIKEKDRTRYTTNGINGLNAAGAKMYPIMQDLAPLFKKDAENSETNDSSGSNAINSFMQLMEGEVGDAFAKHPLMTEVLQESCEAMDIIGLNYLTGRHLLDTELYPNKCVLGTETFPADIARLWSVVKKSNQVLGDFTWSGYDYLGEAGCGIFYYDEKTNFGSYFPDRLAYIGDIDLTGYRRPISYLREIVYGMRKEPYIAVERVDRSGMKHSKTPWMLKDNIASWTWEGYEGKSAMVDVYSADEEVELFINGKSLGKKLAGEKVGYVSTFECKYEPGEVTAISYNQGKESSSCQLKTAGTARGVKVDVSQEVMIKGTEELVFIQLSLVDKDGLEVLTEEKEIKVVAEGNVQILAVGNADPQATTSYDSHCWKTYHGKLLLVAKAGELLGESVIHIVMDDNIIKDVSIKVIDSESSF